MRASVERGTHKDGSEYKRVSYMCGNYARSGKGACTCHGIYENALSGLVIDHIRAHALMVQHNEERIVATILSAQNSESLSYRAAYQNELEAHKKQIAKLDLLIENLYEDRVTGLVPDSLFKRQIAKYEQDRVDRLQTVETLEQRIRGIKQNSDNAFAWTKLMKRYTEIETLDAETLLTLIDKIIVGETQIIDGRRVCDVRILYRYVGDIDRFGLVEYGEAVTEYEREAV